MIIRFKSSLFSGKSKSAAVRGREGVQTNEIPVLEIVLLLKLTSCMCMGTQSQH